MLRLRQTIGHLGRDGRLPWSGVGLVLLLMGATVLPALLQAADPWGGRAKGGFATIELAAGLPAPRPDNAAPAARLGGGPWAEIPGNGRVAVLLLGVGLDPVLTRTAMELSSPVAMGWSVYADDTQHDRAMMRGRGHEIWLELPVSRGDPSRFDAGPLALTPARSDAHNLQRLDAALARLPGLDGVVAEPGAFAASPQRLRPLSDLLAGRGLPLLLHGDFTRMVVAEPGIAAGRADRSMGVTTLAGAIDQVLDELALQAGRHGAALAVMRAHPLSIARLLRWQASLAGRGLTLVPPSLLLHAARDPPVAVQAAP